MQLVFGVPMIIASLLLCPSDLQKSSDVDSWKQLHCTGTSVTSKYINYAEGFSISIPPDLIGRRGQAAGPERGVSIPLSADCEGVVDISGEPNSLEWPTREDAIAWEIAHATGAGIRVTRYASKLGSLRAAGATLRSERTGDVN